MHLYKLVVCTCASSHYAYVRRLHVTRYPDRKQERSRQHRTKSVLIPSPMKTSKVFSAFCLERRERCAASPEQPSPDSRDFNHSAELVTPPQPPLIPIAATRHCHANLLVHTDVSTHVLEPSRRPHHGLQLKFCMIFKHKRRLFCSLLGKICSITGHKTTVCGYTHKRKTASRQRAVSVSYM